MPGSSPTEPDGRDVDQQPDGSDRPTRRGPPGRIRAALLAAGSVAGVVGCTAAVAALVGDGRSGEAVPDDARTSLSVPDRPLIPDEVDPPRRDSGTAGPSDDASADSESDLGSAEPEPADSPADPEPTPTPTPTAEPTPTASGGGDEDTEAPDDPQPPVLRRGDTGAEVEELQHRLRQLRDLYEGEITGEYDGRTEDAVRRFQIWYGVREDEWGVYGPASRQQLEDHTQAP